MCFMLSSNLPNKNMMTLPSAYFLLEGTDSIHQQQQPAWCCGTDGRCVFCRQGFVPADSVTHFRKQLGCDTFRTEEKGTGCICHVQKSAGKRIK